MGKRNRIFTFFDVAIIVVLTAIIMYFLGGILVFKHLGGVNYSLLADDKSLQEFIAAYNDLVDNYYDQLDKTELIEGAISGMYSKINDPYTTYLDSNNSANLTDMLNGSYQGIGVRIGASASGEVVIAEVFEGSPAAKAGLLEGDVIIKVNSEDVTAKGTTEIVNLIKGSNSQSTDITVNRNGESHTYTVSIEDLMVPVVNAKLLNRNGKNIGYISMSVFNDTADVQFANSLSSLENSGISSLVIDLRGNSGGYLQVAENIAEMFLEKGKIIYTLESKESKEDYKDNTSEKRTYPVVVLVNKSSASASEILAAALKYSYGATVIGETSYGKGKVQERAGLSNGNTVKYTTALWLTPNGDCVDGLGLVPDEIVALDVDTYNPYDIYSDSQVLYALKYLAD